MTTPRIPDTFWVVDGGTHPKATAGTAGRSFTVRGSYVDSFWTPVLGPATILAARRLAYRLGDRGTMVKVNAADLAAEIGLRAGGGPGSVPRIAKPLGRLCTFGLAEWDHPDRLILFTRWPLVSERDAAHLPDTLRPYARPPARTARTA